MEHPYSGPASPPRGSFETVRFEGRSRENVDPCLRFPGGSGAPQELFCIPLYLELITMRSATSESMTRAVLEFSAKVILIETLLFSLVAMWYFV
jgi:hypothetical protein